jgi:hypothetical protein
MKRVCPPVFPDRLGIQREKLRGQGDGAVGKNKEKKKNGEES